MSAKKQTDTCIYMYLHIYLVILFSFSSFNINIGSSGNLFFDTSFYFFLKLYIT